MWASPAREHFGFPSDPPRATVVENGPIAGDVYIAGDTILGPGFRGR